MPDTADLDRYLIHAGRDTVHKMKTGIWPGSGKTVANTTRTECGCLTTHMSEIQGKQLDRVPEENFCKHCFR